jgi:hypothetical protein
VILLSWLALSLIFAGGILIGASVAFTATLVLMDVRAREPYFPRHTGGDWLPHTYRWDEGDVTETALVGNVLPPELASMAQAVREADWSAPADWTATDLPSQPEPVTMIEPAGPITDQFDLAMFRLHAEMEDAKRRAQQALAIGAGDHGGRDRA